MTFGIDATGVHLIAAAPSGEDPSVDWDCLDRLADVYAAARAHDLLIAHLPLTRSEEQPDVGLAVWKYVLMRRGAVASDAQRKPESAVTATGRAEVDYLLKRLTAKDARAMH